MPSKAVSGKRRPPPFAVRARMRADVLELDLDNGTTVQCPLDNYPGILLAPERAKKNVHVGRPGIEIRWPTLGYELGVEGLLSRCTPVKRSKG